MNAADFIQIAILIVLALTLAAVWRQLQGASLNLRLSTSLSRKDAFDKLHDPISKEEIQTFLLHLPDHIDLATYEDRYKGNDTRIRSFILMKKKYLYLLYSADIEKRYEVLALGTADKWLSELVQYQEFQDVHARHASYYPDFAKRVASVTVSSDAHPWLCELVENSS